MRTRPWSAGFVLALMLAGCSSTTFAPSPVPPSGAPYAGLGEGSYGPRSATQFRSCDPQVGVASPTSPPGSPPSRLDAATQAVSTALAAPVQGMMKIDATLQSLDLARHFKDPVGSAHPPVAVLAHSKDSIVFWHSTRLVGLPEVGKAAQAYCAQLQRPLLYRGSSIRCPAAERGLTGALVQDTYAISAYACATRP